MNANQDFSQFLRKAPANQSKNSNTEFSQFLRKPKREDGGLYEEFIERPGQIMGQAVAAGFRALPRTAYDLTKTLVGALGGNLSKQEEFEKNAPEWLKKSASEAFPTYEEVREKQKDLKTLSGKKIAQPEGSFEKGLEKFGRFVGEAPSLGGVGGVKGLLSLGGLAAGIQIGEESNLGPIGQLVTGAIGAATPAGVGRLFKAVISPKKNLAKAVAKFTPQETIELQKQIINDAREAGIQLDIGTMTKNHFIEGLQTKLASSSLTGNALEEFKKTLSNQVVAQYKKLADNLGKAQFETVHDAGEVLQNALKAERDVSQRQYRDIYNGSKKRLSDASVVYPDKVIATINRLESELKPGSLKGTEQKAVLQFIEDLKKDVMTAEGQLKGAKVKDLINDKVAIHDIVDYEIEGGTKKLLITLAKEIDETIQQYGRIDAQFAKDYKLADKKFGEHSRTFRNKNIAASLKTQDPRQILSKMNTTQGIREIKKALHGSAEGRELFKDISRFKLEQLIEKSLEQGASNQIQFGKFGNTLTKGQNRELVRELLGKQGFESLDRLMKTSHRISESANKFLNTSKTASTLFDMGLAGTLLTEAGYALAGNPWPFALTAGGLAVSRQTAKLISNPEFLKMVEEAILASNTNNPTIMKHAADRLLETAKTTLRASGEVSDKKKT
jgi:hypothetical protein